MSGKVKGVPGHVKVDLPLWQVKEIVRDIANVISCWQGGAAYPLSLSDFGKELASALEEAKE